MAITLTTLAEIRAYTGITASQIGDDDLTRIAEGAEGRIFRICNRPDGFLTASHTELVAGRNRDTLYVTYSPITAITSIKLVLDSTNKETIDSTLYTFETGYSGRIAAYNGTINKHVGTFESGRPLVETIRPQALFAEGGHRKNIEVIYTGGYADVDSVPEDLSQAVIDTTKWLGLKRTRDFGLQSESLGSYSYSRAPASEIDKATGLPVDIAEAIRPYIRMMRA